MVRESAPGATGASGAESAGAKGAGAKGAKGATGATGAKAANGALTGVLDQLRALEDARRDGEVTLPNGDKVKITNPAKLFWPASAPGGLRRGEPAITKGDLLRYYVEVSPYILPVVQDRPLVMKRFPNGVDGKAFYQQRSREERPPAGVRIETLEDSMDPISELTRNGSSAEPHDAALHDPDRRHLAGPLVLARAVAALVDQCAIDLDPMTGVNSTRCSTSPAGCAMRCDAGVPASEDIWRERSAHLHPAPRRDAVRVPASSSAGSSRPWWPHAPESRDGERTVKPAARTEGLCRLPAEHRRQVAGTAYSARASDYAGASTPLTWKEVDGKVDPRDFTIRTAPARFAKVGDLWKGLRTTAPADLEAVFERFKKG